MTLCLNMTAVWDMAPRSLLEVDRRFRGVYCQVAPIVEALSASETSVYFYETTRRHIPESSRLRIRHREHMKSHATVPAF
jgi:hypothetical protein